MFGKDSAKDRVRSKRRLVKKGNQGNQGSSLNHAEPRKEIMADFKSKSRIMIAPKGTKAPSSKGQPDKASILGRTLGRLGYAKGELASMILRRNEIKWNQCTGGKPVPAEPIDQALRGKGEEISDADKKKFGIHEERREQDTRRGGRN